MSWSDWSSRAARGWSDRVAVVDVTTGLRLTYGDLDHRANLVAEALVAAGVGCGDRVLVLAANRVEQVDLYFATQKIGAALVPLNWRLAPEELVTIARDAQPALLIHESQPAASVQALRAALPEVPAWDLAVPDAWPPPSHGRPVQIHAARPEDVAMILYTSGTTGKPKGVMISMQQITANSLNTTLSFDLRHDDITVTYTPLFHTGGWHALTTPILHRGGRVVLMSGFDPGRILELIRTERLTLLFGVPTTFQMLAEHPDFATSDLSSLRFCLCGGAPCPEALIGQYGRRGLVFRQGYGLTEVGPNCFSLPPEDALRKIGTVGRPVFHCDARLVDAQDQPVPAGTIGQIQLSGSHVTIGYFRQPEATAAVLRGGWFSTGDLGVMDADGYYRIVGRSKDMFISGGENVYPAEVENLLAAHPDVLEVAVIPVPDPRWGEVGRAVVVLRPGREATPGQLLATLEGHLARYKIPKSLVLVDALPRNPTGKVVKATCIERWGRVD